MTTTGVLINLMVNRANPPFDNPDMRKAMSLALDRKPFNTILMEGNARLGGAMLPKPTGEWGMPDEMVNSLTGYGPDTEKNIAEAQGIMEKLGYSDANPLQIKIQTRNLPTYRDPGGDRFRSAQEDPYRQRIGHSRHAALVLQALAQGIHDRSQRHRGRVDDPDGNIVENYLCNSERNYTQYCNAEVDKLLAAQSRELDREKRKKIVWDIERILVEDAARPVILHGSAGNCWQPYVKNFKPHDNSQYNNLRFEDVWLDK